MRRCKKLPVSTDFFWSTPTPRTEYFWRSGGWKSGLFRVMAYLLEFADATGTEKRRRVFVEHADVQQTLAGTFSLKCVKAAVAQKLLEVITLAFAHKLWGAACHRQMPDGSPGARA
jgi:hypothetical protein